MTEHPEPERDTAPLDRQRLRVWLRLLRLTRAVSNELRERLRAEFDITLPQFDVLAALYRHDRGLTMTALSGALMVSNGNVTGIVARLVAAGLVVRIPDRLDRRAARVRLTRRGRESFARMAEVHRGWVDAAFGGLDARGVEEMLRLVERAGGEA